MARLSSFWINRRLQEGRFESLGSRKRERHRHRLRVCCCLHWRSWHRWRSSSTPLSEGSSHYSADFLRCRVYRGQPLLDILGHPTPYRSGTSVFRVESAASNG